MILPQGLRRMVPATVSQLITLNKDTTLVSIIAITEVMRRARIVTASNFFTVVEAPILHVFIFVGLLFVIVNYSLSRLSRRLELRERKITGTKLKRVAGAGGSGRGRPGLTFEFARVVAGATVLACRLASIWEVAPCRALRSSSSTATPSPRPSG